MCQFWGGGTNDPGTRFLSSTFSHPSLPREKVPRCRIERVCRKVGGEMRARGNCAQDLRGACGPLQISLKTRRKE